MYAIIVTGGKQYKVEEGSEIFVELLDNEQGDNVELKAIAIGTEDGIKLGNDIKNAKVSAEVLKNGKGTKIRVFTYKPKKSSARCKGHRQPYTKLKITSISL